MVKDDQRNLSKKIVQGLNWLIINILLLICIYQE